MVWKVHEFHISFKTLGFGVFHRHLSICLSIYQCISIYFYLLLSTSIYFYLLLSTSIYFYLLYPYLSVSICIYLSSYLAIYACIDIHTYTYSQTLSPSHSHVHIYRQIYTSLYACESCVYIICIYIYNVYVGAPVRGYRDAEVARGDLEAWTSAFLCSSLVT